MFKRKTKSVLLVDFDNIAAQLGHNEFVSAIPRWLAWLEDGHFNPANGKRTFIVKKMYWNTPGEYYRKAVEAQEFEALLCPSKVKGKKSLADMVIAVDALRAAYENKRMQECVLLAVDTDYEPLLDGLNDCSQRTVIAAQEGIAMEVFSECADVVIPLDKLREAMRYQRPRRALEVLKDKLRAWRTTPSRKDKMLALAASHLIDVGKQQPGRDIAKKTVMKSLEDNLRLVHKGAHAYLSCGNYDTMLEQIAAQSDELVLHEYDERRRAIAWRAPKQQATALRAKKRRSRRRARPRWFLKRGQRHPR